MAPRPLQGARREASLGQDGLGVLRAALPAAPGGLRDTALTIKGGREGFSREWRAARRRVWSGPESRKSPVWSAERRASERTHGTRRCLGPASWALNTLAPIGAPPPVFNGGHRQTSEDTLPRENDDACSNSIRSSPHPVWGQAWIPACAGMSGGGRAGFAFPVCRHRALNARANAPMARSRPQGTCG